MRKLTRNGLKYHHSKICFKPIYKKITGLKNLFLGFQRKEKQSALGSPFCKLLINLIKFETNGAKETASQVL